MILLYTSSPICRLFEVSCLQCSQIIPYDDGELIGEKGPNEVESWNLDEELDRELIL